MSPNAELLEMVARALGPLKYKNVYVGGATTHLLISDPSAPGVTPTSDVDVVVDVSSAVEFSVHLGAELRKLGMKEDTSEDAPLCRWKIGSVTVDIMSPNADVLGFSNRWYPTVLSHCESRTVGEVEILVIDAATFLATKIEAYNDRGRGDLLASKDIEDIIAVLDGRPELASELAEREEPLRHFIAHTLDSWKQEDAFAYAVEGYLQADEERIPQLFMRIESIISACRKSSSVQNS